MPITPHFTIHQTISHVELDIRVPHVRVTPKSIQVVVLEDSILHFASPPYLLVLNFAALNDDNDTTDHTLNDNNNNTNGAAAYRFDEMASEACATYEPTIENGMIRLSLKKAAGVAKLWTNLHLLGRMVLPRQPKRRSNHSNSNNQMENNHNHNTPTSRWLLEEVASTKTTTTSSGIDKDEEHDSEKQTHPDTNKRMMKRRQGYGFAGMFEGVFSDLTRDGLAKEMLECPPDADDNEYEEQLLKNVDIHDENNGSNKNDESYTIRRRIQRRQMENDKFDQDRYRQDLHVEDDYIYQCAMAMKPHWMMMPQRQEQQQEQQQHESLSCNGGGGGDGDGGDDMESVTKRLDSLAIIVHEMPNDVSKQQQQQESYYFTEEERLQLVSIPYPLLSPETSLSRQQQPNDKNNHDDNDNDLTMGIVVGLVDLLFAYVYDHLITDGDATVESAWNISILSASLSWMEDWQHIAILPTRTATTTTTTTTRDATRPTSSSSKHNDKDLLEILSANDAAVQEVLYSSLRRALVYPYLRNLGFALLCALQVADIIHNGPCCILRCLLQMRNVLNHSELYYLGSKLFVDPYLAWIQQQNSNLLSSRLAYMARVIRQLVSTFDDVTSREACKQSLGLDLMRIEQEEEMEDHQHDDEHSSSSSDSDDASCSSSGDDADDDAAAAADSSSSEEAQSDDKDDDKSTRLSTCQEAQSPESGRKEQQRSEVKGTAVSSELLDCSLGLSALHIVQPRENNAQTGTFMFSPAIITDENHPREPSTTSKCSKEQQQFEESSLSSKPKKLIVELDD